MKSRVWTPARDKVLKRLEARGWSASEIAGRLSTTRNAVLGRSSRLRGIVFPSNVLLVELARAAAAARRAKRKKREAAILKALDAAMRGGMPRNEAIVKARDAGARWRAIADRFGVTRQAVHQAADRWHRRKLRRGERR